MTQAKRMKKTAGRRAAEAAVVAAVETERAEVMVAVDSAMLRLRASLGRYHSRASVIEACQSLRDEIVQTLEIEAYE